MTEPSRETRIQQAVANAHHYPSETRTVRLRDRKLLLTSVALPLELVLLNPRNHRIQSELEAADKADRELVAADPYSDQAQEILTKLVKLSDGYNETQALMDNQSQRDPGIITAKGVLMNGNTRVVALRSNKKVKTVDVLVLPPDVSNRELLELEFELQMQRESKQEYSFSNQLRFIEDMLNADLQPEEVGRAVDPGLNVNIEADRRKAKQLVEREMRLLVLARLVVKGSSNQIPLHWFDDKRQALIEIDQDYQALVGRDPDEARRVRDAQLAAMIAGVDYRQLRKVDTTLLNDYLAPAVEADPILKPHATSLLAPSDGIPSSEVPQGLALFGAPSVHSTTKGKPSLDRVFQLLATTADADIVQLPASGDAATPADVAREVFTAAVSRAVEVAIDNRKRDDAKSDELTAPVQYLEEARRAIDNARRAHLRALGRDPDNGAQPTLVNAPLPGYDAAATSSKVDAVERALDDLRAELS